MVGSLPMLLAATLAAAPSGGGQAGARVRLAAAAVGGSVSSTVALVSRQYVVRAVREVAGTRVACADTVAPRQERAVGAWSAPGPCLASATARGPRRGWKRAPRAGGRKLVSQRWGEPAVRPG